MIPNADLAPELDRLAYLHDKGLLVPFLGAGMSVNAARDWKGFVRALEERAALTSGSADESEAGLVRRANKAVRQLRRDPGVRLPDEIRAAITNADHIPAQTARLAELDWDLVLTTNYDSHFVDAYLADRGANASGATQSALRVCGRQMEDCHTVLASLDTPTETVVWALQGFLGSTRYPNVVSRPLDDELVVGHSEYRRAAHTALHFRRAFAEVFRRRTLLFLGSSLTDSYLLDLFGEVIELFGPAPMPHYALVSEKEDIDAEFLRDRLNIRVLRYDHTPDHRAVPEFLTDLRTRAAGRTGVVRQWTYQSPNISASPEMRSAAVRRNELSIVLGSITQLPVNPETEALCISCGLEQGKPYIDPVIDSAVERNLQLRISSGPWKSAGASLWELATTDQEISVTAACAWVTDNRRDIRLIQPAARAAFDWAVENRKTHLRMTLIGSGRTRHFSPIASLALIIRAWRFWSMEAVRELSLSIHVIDLEVARALSSGRFDPEEILSSDQLRFWSEVVTRPEEDRSGIGLGNVEREALLLSGETQVHAVAAMLDIPFGAPWRASLHPPVQRDGGQAISGTETLNEIGLVPGGILRFTRDGRSVDRAST